MQRTQSLEQTIRERIRTEGAQWLAEQQFWLFGTARYADGSKIKEHRAIKDARHYFNTIDRALLARKDYNEGHRLKRLVFLETGRSRTNTHIHFYIKGTALNQYRHIKLAAEQLWTRHILQARDCVVLDNINLNNERKGYCWKEFDTIRSTTLLVDCCHL